jgi:hypothetical protein
MAETVTGVGDVKALRARLVERFAGKLDQYLPESGELRTWTVSEIEEALSKDMNEMARDVIESRIQVDPRREPRESPRCPECGRVLGGLNARRAHRHTILGPVELTRSTGYCQACDLAFSPSGHRVALRKGLL